jgi:hypothetical protein
VAHCRQGKHLFQVDLQRILLPLSTAPVVQALVEAVVEEAVVVVAVSSVPARQQLCK